MSDGNKKKIVRLLGVGFDADDGHIRITNDKNHDVLMGSDESHDYLQKLLSKIEDALEIRGLNLDDLSPEEFTKFVESIL